MRRLASMLGMISAVLLSGATAAGAAGWQDMTGPHATVLIAQAGPAGEYYIRRPAKLAARAHPVAVFLVGSNSHPKRSDALLDELASHGVIAIAHSSSDQGDGTKASAALNWLLEQNESGSSEYFHTLIPSKVLAIGHSSGGNGAVLAALQNPRITSVLLYAPALSQSPTTELRVPTFFVAGALDRTATPDEVKAGFLQATKAAAWFGVVENQGHAGFGASSTVQYFTRAWVYTQLFDDAGAARDCFYGTRWTLNGAPGWKEALKNSAAP